MWLLLALSATLINSFENVLQKRSTQRFSVFIVAWAVLVSGSLFYLPVLLHVGWLVHLGPLFWPAVLARVAVDSIALVLFFKALQLAHLSLAIPMLALRPVFVVVSSLLLNHLFPSPLGLVGIGAIVVGVYVLNFDRQTKQLLSPFRNIIRNRGVLYMLIGCVFSSVAAALLRLGIDNSNATFYTLFFQPFWAVCFLPIVFVASRGTVFKSLATWRSLVIFLPIGMLDALQLLLQNVAYSLTIPAYISAVQSMGILFASIFGYYFFGEKLHGKVSATFVVIIGVALIALS
jgi:drug/metabolite transporter (DMT)-like permease